MEWLETQATCDRHTKERRVGQMGERPLGIKQWPGRHKLVERLASDVRRASKRRGSMFPKEQFCGGAITRSSKSRESRLEWIERYFGRWDEAWTLRFERKDLLRGDSLWWWDRSWICYTSPCLPWWGTRGWLRVPHTFEGKGWKRWRNR